MSWWPRTVACLGTYMKNMKKRSIQNQIVWALTKDVDKNTYFGIIDISPTNVQISDTDLVSGWKKL